MTCNRSLSRFGWVCGVSALVSLSALPTHAQLALQNESRPSTILLHETDEGVVFTDTRGMTLYSGLDPKPNISTCTSDVTVKPSPAARFPLLTPDQNSTCTAKQPPVLVGDGKAVGPWTIVNRPDGLRQWSYNGKPLYTSVKDFVPGDTNGIGFGQDVVTAEIYGKAGPIFAPRVLPPEVRIRTVGVAQVLTTADGRTLYNFDLDAIGKSACEGRCSSTWPPLLASMIAAPNGDWSIVIRGDKSRQWAFKGKPLYTYADDRDGGDYAGNGRPNWKVALAYSLPSVPPALTVVHTLLGPRFANSEGRTLYTFMCMTSTGNTMQGAFQMACDDPTDKTMLWIATCGNAAKCLDIWRPVIADKDAKASGRTWTIVTVPEPWSPVRAIDEKQPGLKVWAYKGRPVFTYKFEDRPGMIDGEDVGELAAQKWFSINAVGNDINRSAKVALGRAANQ